MRVPKQENRVGLVSTILDSTVDQQTGALSSAEELLTLNLLDILP